tara:strand:- start:732 stop:857 length:126 start_codon:yes stop_codon:yes gene_type:complete
LLTSFEEKTAPLNVLFKNDLGEKSGFQKKEMNHILENPFNS